jgi:hypothetical protein
MPIMASSKSEQGFAGVKKIILKKSATWPVPLPRPACVRNVV